MLLEADPSILTPLTLSASSIATLGSNMPGFSGERESVNDLSFSSLLLPQAFCSLKFINGTLWLYMYYQTRLHCFLVGLRWLHSGRPEKCFCP